jgi:serine/threonine protein kinase
MSDIFSSQKKDKNYKIEEIIGKGGQGIVYKCLNEEKNTYHAVKKKLIIN